MRTLAFLAVTAALVAAVFAVRALDAQPVAVVEGLVRDPAGLPIPSVWIAREGYRNRSGGVPWWRTDVHGRFRVDGVSEGKVLLRVVPGDASILTGEVVETSANVRDLVIVVEPGPQLLMRIADYVAPEGEPRHARLTWAEPDGRRVTRYAPIRKDGWTRFVRLPQDRDLEAWALAKAGRPVRTSSLRAGDTEVRLVAVAGQEIRGKLVVSARDSVRNVGLSAYAHRGFRIGSASIEADGTFVVSDLPEGTYRVSASFESGNVSVPVARELRTGTTDAVLDLRR